MLAARYLGMLALLTLVAIPRAAFSQGYGAGSKEVTSPSGQYRLKIGDPMNALRDAGPTTYEVLKEGKSVWNKTLPFFLYDVVIGDEGVITGYSYDGGLRGISREHVFMNVWNIDTSGNTTELKHVQRYPDLDRITFPVGGHMILQEPQDRVFVTISHMPEGQYAKTHIFRYVNSTGAADGEWEMEHMQYPDGAQQLIGTQAIYPTGLTLMAWASKSGDLLAGLYDLDGKQVWADHFKNGWTWTMSEDQTLILLLTALGPPIGYPTGAFVKNPISSSGKPNTFFLRIKDERVLFEVGQKESGWGVKELSRSPVPIPSGAVSPVHRPHGTPPE